MTHSKSTLTVIPCSLKEANEFVKRWHRHRGRVVGHKFSIAIADLDGTIHGVCIVGRPVNRTLDNGWTLEVNRVATDGFSNACSALYGAAWRATRALGYRRLVTYTLTSEPGTSLKAAGWKCIGECGGGSWNRKNRPRVDMAPLQIKLRWEPE